MLSEVRWAGYTLGGSHPGLQGILAEQPPAADALQPPLRCGFRARLMPSVGLSRKNYGKKAERVVKMPRAMWT